MPLIDGNYYLLNPHYGYRTVVVVSRSRKKTSRIEIWIIRANLLVLSTDCDICFDSERLSLSPVQDDAGAVIVILRTSARSPLDRIVGLLPCRNLSKLKPGLLRQFLFEQRGGPRSPLETWMSELFRISKDISLRDSPADYNVGSSVKTARTADVNANNRKTRSCSVVVAST